MGRMDDLLRRSGRGLSRPTPEDEAKPAGATRPRPQQPQPQPAPQPEDLELLDGGYDELEDDEDLAPPPETASRRPAPPAMDDDDGDGGGIRIVDAPPQREPISDIDKQRLVSLFAPASPQAKRIDMLRSQLLYPFHGDPPRTIMITSAAPREGRSLLTTNLAISFARGLQQFVLVIDCHLANPAIHRLLQVPLRPGLTDYLEHGSPLPGVIHWTAVDKLSVIPAGRPSRRTAEILATDKMVDMMYELRERYRDRFIILDTPPVQEVDDPAVLARVVEGIVFVAMGGVTEREQVLRAMRSLPEEKIIGVVLNDPQGSVLDAPGLAGGVDSL